MIAAEGGGLLVPCLCPVFTRVLAFADVCRHLRTEESVSTANHHKQLIHRVY